MVPSSAAGYDAPVAGIDEPTARSTLAAMQDRLARDPSSALGLDAHATADDVRVAFLELTKRYHPVRFGRMSLEIQKMSNEVFLALRAAHDTLAKSLRRRSGPIPTIGAGQGSAPVARPALAATAPAAAPRAMPAGPALPRTITPTASIKAPVTRPLSAQLPATSSPASRPPTAGPRATGSFPTAPPASAGHPAPPSPAAAATEAAVLDLLARQQWDQARSALHQLIARDPQSKRMKALMAYARGREAQLDRRLDDARVELHDALDLDPELSLAKTALTELFTRRK
jgi:hypothetical protein